MIRAHKHPHTYPQKRDKFAQFMSGFGLPEFFGKIFLFPIDHG